MVVQETVSGGSALIGCPGLKDYGLILNMETKTLDIDDNIQWKQPDYSHIKFEDIEVSEIDG